MFLNASVEVSFSGITLRLDIGYMEQEFNPIQVIVLPVSPQAYYCVFGAAIRQTTVTMSALNPLRHPHLSLFNQTTLISLYRLLSLSWMVLK